MRCRFVIYVAAGIYEESVTLSKRMVNLTIIGEGSQKSIIVGRKSVADGVNIYDTATFGTLVTLTFWHQAGAPELC